MLVIEISGIRPAKGDAAALLEANALRVVADVCSSGKHTHVSSHFKPTRKALNTFKSTVRLSAGASIT